MRTYDLIEEIDNIIEGFWLEKIEGYSIVGEIRSNAQLHPIQYRAYTNVPPGSDDPIEGVGWTPQLALKDLRKALKDHRDNPIEDEVDD